MKAGSIDEKVSEAIVVGNQKAGKLCWTPLPISATNREGLPNEYLVKASKSQ